MTITVNGPDGATYNFPDETPPDEMTAALAKVYPAPAASAQPPTSNGPGVMAGVSRALEANLPFVDRAVAGAKSVLPQGYGGTGQDYAANLTTERAKNAQFASDNPWTNAVGGITAYAPAALIPGGAGLYGRIGAGALTGFGLGGLQGASNSPDLTDTQETGQSIAQGELSGGAFGGAFPAVAHGIGSGYSKLADALRGGPGPADLAALGAAKNSAYQNVKDLGAAYSPQSFKSLTDKIASDAAEADIDPDLNPKAAKVIANLQNRSAEAIKSGTPVTLTDLDKARQFVNDNLSGLPEPKQARFGALIKNNIDDFVNTAFPGDMVPMPAKGAGAPTAHPGPQVSQSFKIGEDKIAAPQVPPGPAPTPMLDFLRRAGGVQDEGGDLASMGFSNLKGVAGRGSSKIIDKENGLPMDEARRMAVESGYMEPHEDVSDLINKLGEHPTYSIHDQEAVAARAARDAEPTPELGNNPAGIAPEDFSGLGEEPPFAPRPVPAAMAPAPSGPVANSQEAAEAIRNARDLAQRQFKANALSEALGKAADRAAVSGTGGNIENTTRQKLLAIRDNEPWSQDELAQLNRVIRGTPETNSLRDLSRFGPKGNALMAALELGAIGTGHPLLAIAGAGGMAAQGLGALARRNAQNELMRTILAGGTAPVRSSTQGPVSRAAMAAALAANADLQARRSQVTQP